jgi:pimeloyl-ACP methyl ester carboxylesterase
MPVPAGLPAAVVIFYLHGFASSAQSTKGRYFQERLADLGRPLVCPDFNAPEFRMMTMTRMLDQLDQALAHSGPAPATLIGSSLGGTLAVLAAERFGGRVDRLVLMAPAVMFAKPGHHLLPPERIEEWRRQGSLPFFHYGAGEERSLDFSFYEDSLRYDAFGAQFSQPTLVFQGLHDRSVDPGTVEEFARARPNARLLRLEDDHQLLSSWPLMWDELRDFLALE